MTVEAMIEPQEVHDAPTTEIQEVREELTTEELPIEILSGHQEHTRASLRVMTEAENFATSSGPSVTPDSQEAPRWKEPVNLVTPASFSPKAVDPPARNSPWITAAMSPLGNGTNVSKFFPGIGKMLALPSQKACDVDAFVDDDEDDDDATSLGSYPLYPSSTDTTGDSCDDLEANGNSLPRTPSIRKLEPPLDPNTDPFASRVGKTLAWCNVNMTLVRCVLFDKLVVKEDSLR
jgi:hypothetical protein